MSARLLVTGNLYGEPQARTSQAGKSFTTAKLRADGKDGNSLWISLTAFGELAEPTTPLPYLAGWRYPPIPPRMDRRRLACLWSLMNWPRSKPSRSRKRPRPPSPPALTMTCRIGVDAMPRPRKSTTIRQERKATAARKRAAFEFQAPIKKPRQSPGSMLFDATGSPCKPPVANYPHPTTRDMNDEICR